VGSWERPWEVKWGRAWEDGRNEKGWSRGRDALGWQKGGWGA
jgi:hypothetical protein